MAEMDLRRSDVMSSRLVAALAAVILVAATSLDIGAVRADVIPIHRGLPNDGYGEPDDSGEIHGLPVWTRMTGLGPSAMPSQIGSVVTEWIVTRFVVSRPHPGYKFAQRRPAPRGTH